MVPRRTMVVGVGIFVLVVVSLQIFLIMVGLEAWITFDARVAWAAAATSVGLAIVSVLLYALLHRYAAGAAPRRGPDRRPPRGHRRTSS